MPFVEVPSSGADCIILVMTSGLRTHYWEEFEIGLHASATPALQAPDLELNEDPPIAVG